MRAAQHPRRWRRACYSGLTIAVALVSLACATSAPPAAPPPTPAGALGAGETSLAGWQREWEATLAAARQEGKVVISAVGSDSYRLPLTAFENDYPDIKVEFTGLRAPDFWIRVGQERAAGQYLWDLRVGGPQVQVYQAKDEGVLEPVRPLLLLPEVLDDSKWLEGIDGLFVDKEKQFVVAFFASGTPSMFVNRDLVPETELRSVGELLAPKFRGKIALGDPRGGPGLGQLTILLAAYGEEFVTELLTRQAIVPTQDIRQLGEWVVRGRYPIALGLPKYQVDQFRNEGLGGNVTGLDGPLELSMAAGGIQLLKNAPHPNAAKVYVNWLLTQKTQNALAQSTSFNSRRRDVPPADPAGVVDPGQLDLYIAHQSEQLVPLQERAQQLATRLLP